MTKIRFLILISFLTIIGCARDCPDFNNEVLDWMPYKVADIVEINNSVSSESLIVNTSQIYHSDKVSFGVKCACLNTYVLNLSSHSFNIDIRYSDSKEIGTSEIVVNGEWLDYSEQKASIFVNGNNYYDVIIYESRNLLTPGSFSKVIIAKSIGIVAIIGENEEWGINYDNKRTIDISEVDFMASDC